VVVKRTRLAVCRLWKWMKMLNLFFNDNRNLTSSAGQAKLGNEQQHIKSKGKSEIPLIP